MISIVSNSSPIIALSKIGQLSLLNQLFDTVFVPNEVYKEIALDPTNSTAGKLELQQSIDHGQITLYSVQNSLLINKLEGKLHRGELEVIVAAKELNLKLVLIDEIAARKLATTFFIQPIGTLGLLKLAKQEQKIDNVKPYIDSLVSQGFRINSKLYKQTLLDAGE